jgi:hypothetical protein
VLAGACASLAAALLVGCGSVVRTVSEFSLQGCLNRVGADAQFVDRMLDPLIPGGARAAMSGFGQGGPWQSGSIAALQTQNGVGYVSIYVFATAAQARVARRRLGPTAQKQDNVAWIDYGVVPAPAKGPLPAVDRAIRRCIAGASTAGMAPGPRPARPNTMSGTEYSALRAAAGDLQIVIAENPGMAPWNEGGDPNNDPSVPVLEAVTRILERTRGQSDSLRLPWPDRGRLGTWLAQVAAIVRPAFPDLSVLLQRRPRVSTPYAYFARLCGGEIIWTQHLDRLLSRLRAKPVTDIHALQSDFAGFLIGAVGATSDLIRVLRSTPPPLFANGLTFSSQVVIALNHLRLDIADAYRRVLAAPVNDPSVFRVDVLAAARALQHALQVPLRSLAHIPEPQGEDLLAVPPACFGLPPQDVGPGAMKRE